MGAVRPIIGSATDPGDPVVDPFNGSGTAGCAAKELQRRYVGIDSAEFLGIAEKGLLFHGV